MKTNIYNATLSLDALFLIFWRINLIYFLLFLPFCCCYILYVHLFILIKHKYTLIDPIPELYLDISQWFQLPLHLKSHDTYICWYLIYLLLYLIFKMINRGKDPFLVLFGFNHSISNPMRSNLRLVKLLTNSCLRTCQMMSDFPNASMSGSTDMESVGL